MLKFGDSEYLMDLCNDLFPTLSKSQFIYFNFAPCATCSSLATSYPIVLLVRDLAPLIENVRDLQPYISSQLNPTDPS